MKISDALQTLRTLDIYPKKGLGQNFLVSEGALRKIVAAAELQPADIVLEIGPGPGTLTSLLAEQAGRVVAVELDARLAPLLRREFNRQSHVHVVEGDILQMSPGDLVGNPPAGYLVVANLPYYITSAVLRHLLEAANPPYRLVLTVQLEVAQRIVARPPDMSLLAVSVQFYANPVLVTRIPAGAFYPTPKVDSAVVRMVRWPTPVVAAEPKSFFRVVSAGFGQKRKTLRNSLSQGLSLPAASVAEKLAEAGIDPMRRAETLTLAEWGTVVAVFTQPG